MRPERFKELQRALGRLRSALEIPAGGWTAEHRLSGLVSGHHGGHKHACLNASGIAFGVSVARSRVGGVPGKFNEDACYALAELVEALPELLLPETYGHRHVVLGETGSQHNIPQPPPDTHSPHMAFVSGYNQGWSEGQSAAYLEDTEAEPGGWYGEGFQRGYTKALEHVLTESALRSPLGPFRSPCVLLEAIRDLTKNPQYHVAPYPDQPTVRTYPRGWAPVPKDKVVWRDSYGIEGLSELEVLENAIKTVAEDRAFGHLGNRTWYERQVDLPLGEREG